MLSLFDFRRPDAISFLGYVKRIERMLRQDGYTNICTGDMGVLADILAVKRGVTFGLICRQRVRTMSTVRDVLEAASHDFYRTRQLVFVTPHALDRASRAFADERGLTCLTLDGLLPALDALPGPHAARHAALSASSNSS